MTLEEALKAGPLSLDWKYGAIPAVEHVPFDCMIALWAPEYIGIICPDGDAQNPLRWGDAGGSPAWGNTPPIGWWVVLRPGSKPLPEGIQTWAEMFGEASMARLPESVLYSTSRVSDNCWMVVRRVQLGLGPRGGKRRWEDDPNWHNPGFSDEHSAETAANNLQQEEIGMEPAFLPPTGPRP